VVLNKEERQVLEKLYSITMLDKKSLTEVFVNLGSLLVLSSVSPQNSSVSLPFVGKLQKMEGGGWLFSPSDLLKRSVQQAQDGDPSDMDKLLMDSIGHIYRNRV
jgi:hypothetical protein